MYVHLKALTFLFVGLVIFPEPFNSVLQLPFFSTAFIVHEIIQEQPFQGLDV